MPSRSTRARAAATAAVVAGALALTGCGAGTAPQQPIPLASAWHPGLFVDGYGPSGLGPSPTASPSASASAGASAASPAASDTSLADPTQAMLQTLLLQPGDVPSGLKVVLDDQGASLSVPTLTYCAGSYASERARQARRRSEVETTAGARAGIATEAVLYAKAADAQSALQQLRDVAAGCASPRTVTSGTSTIVFTVVPSNDVATSGFVPDADRVMVSTTVDDGTGAPYRLTRLWQRRGRVLVALYYSGAMIAPGSTATFTAQDLGNVAALGTTLARRLDALDPAVVAAS